MCHLPLELADDLNSNPHSTERPRACIHEIVFSPKMEGISQFQRSHTGTLTSTATTPTKATIPSPTIRYFIGSFRLGIGREQRVGGLRFTPARPSFSGPHFRIGRLRFHQAISRDWIESAAAAAPAAVQMDPTGHADDLVGVEFFLRLRRIIRLIQRIPFAVCFDYAEEARSALEHQMLAFGGAVFLICPC